MSKTNHCASLPSLVPVKATFYRSLRESLCWSRRCSTGVPRSARPTCNLHDGVPLRGLNKEYSSLVAVVIVAVFTHHHQYRYCLPKNVPAGSPSHSGDVAMNVLDINQPSLPIPFYSALVSAGVFMALSTVFHSINSPDKSLLSYSVLPVLRLPYCPFNCIYL